MRFSIRTLLVLVAVCAVAFFVWHVHVEQMRWKATESLQQLADIEAHAHRAGSDSSETALLRGMIEGICEDWNVKEPAPRPGPPLGF